MDKDEFLIVNLEIWVLIVQNAFSPTDIDTGPDITSRQLALTRQPTPY